MKKEHRKKFKKSLVGYCWVYNLEHFVSKQFKDNPRDRRIHVPIIFNKRYNQWWIKVKITIEQVGDERQKFNPKLGGYLMGDS